MKAAMTGTHPECRRVQRGSMEGGVRPLVPGVATGEHHAALRARGVAIVTLVQTRHLSVRLACRKRLMGRERTWPTSKCSCFSLARPAGVEATAGGRLGLSSATASPV
jgi:hypothetical protein